MKRRTHPLLTGVAAGTLALLYLPLTAVAAMSVNAARFGVTWRGFTLSWYSRLAANEMVLASAANTLVLAAVSTAIATVLGTLLAIGLERFPWPRWTRPVIDSAVYVPC
jgi:spermidine/putrescine transport system permease protein